MSSETRQQCERVNSKFVEDFNKGDIQAACGAYADDAKILPPGSAAIQGRQAIQEFWSGACKQMGITGMSLDTVDFEADGSMAYELGRYGLAGSSGPLDEGNYIIVWKRGADGAWKYLLDIWNSSKA